MNSQVIEGEASLLTGALIVYCLAGMAILRLCSAPLFRLWVLTPGLSRVIF